MRTQSIIGCLVASISLLSWCHDGLAQESEAGADLKSVLKPAAAASTDDLRLLIDLDVPVASEPTKPDTPTATDTKTTAEQIATPAPVDATPAPSTPITRPDPVTQPDPIISTNTDAAPSTSASKIPDPIFDLGLLIKDDIANSTPVVRGVLVDSPAALAGVRTGDKIRKVGKHQTRSSYGLSAELITTNSSVFDLTIERGGEIRVLTVDKSKRTSISTNEFGGMKVGPVASSSPVTPTISPVATTPVVPSSPPAATSAPIATPPARSPIARSSINRSSIVRPNRTPASNSIAPANPVANVSPVPPPAPVPVRRTRVQAQPATSSFTQPPVISAAPARTPQRTSASSVVPPPRPRPITPQISRYQPTPAGSPQSIQNPTSVLTQRNQPRPTPQSAASAVQRRVFASPNASSVRPPVAIQQRVVTRQPGPPQPVGPRPVVVRGQGPIPVQTRPRIGDGGRLIGNGRVINSTLRLFGR